ncbi:MAG: hypothetical protein KF729_24545 [Sandaracinaceae bacterium]|nr:hypothetical protein [Sandaracinaceae bacterium]
MKHTLLFALALLGVDGCLEPATHDALETDESARGGPWTDCTAALRYGRTNEPCDFGEGVGGCGEPLPTSYVYELALCVSGRLTRHTETMVLEDACVAPEPARMVEDDCLRAEVNCSHFVSPDTGEIEVSSVRMHLCPGASAPRDPASSASWSLDAPGGCDAALAAGFAGDPCTGASLCEGRVRADTEDGAYHYLSAWCTNGALVILSPLRAEPHGI